MIRTKIDWFKGKVLTMWLSASKHSFLLVAAEPPYAIRTIYMMSSGKMSMAVSH